MKILKITGIVVGILIALSAITWFGFFKPEAPLISKEDRERINLMPLPAKLSLSNETFLLDETFGYHFENTMSPRLQKAIDRFNIKLSKTTQITFTGQSIDALQVNCKRENSKYPTLADDESYDLIIEEGKIELNANSETGILYGLESLLQLATFHNEQWGFPTLEINDKPRFPWRGLMIDVARHWVSKETILRNLDAMAANKMNVFHWHLTEYQGFRIESKVFPKLHQMGSNGDFYTQEDVKEIINYAANRGIRVIPEFDLPGHATSWFISHPELASAPGPYNLYEKFGIATPAMNPANPEVYDFLDKFFEEMASLFPDEYLHIGGDEVNPSQWNENEKIQEFMDENDLADSHELQAYFNTQLQAILKKHGKIMLGWDEILHPDLPKDGIAIQSWRSQKALWKAASSGNKAILSTGYYLDHKKSAAEHYAVDPLIIPGAVDIEIDSTNWKSWDCIITVQGTEMEGSLYLFGEGENQNGIMNFMDNPTGFENVIIDGNQIHFEVENSIGTIKFDVSIQNDSINGEAKIALFTLGLKGKRNGGNDMPNGIPLPEFEKIEPLTELQIKNILGGEACMWTEMANDLTVESRIWPRAAVIAEKLWSPQSLTSDMDDMYRRLMQMDNYLLDLGMKHQSSSETILREMVGASYFDPAQSLVGVLQEDILFNRMAIYEPELLTTTPLNRVVDAARPESYEAYRFNYMVDQWIDNGQEELEANILVSLENWERNHQLLSVAFNDIDRLKEVEQHSKNLSALSKLAKESILDPESFDKNDENMKQLFEDAQIGYGGTILSVESGLRKIILRSL